MNTRQTSRQRNQSANAAPRVSVRAIEFDRNSKSLLSRASVSTLVLVVLVLISVISMRGGIL